MHNGRILAAVAAVLLAAAQCRLSAALDIVKDGKPAATVVLPDKPSVAEQEAARQIVENIRLSTGAALQTVPEAQAPAAGPVISIGKTTMAQKLNFDVDNQIADAYFLRVQDRTLFLIGRDDPALAVPADNSKAAGTLTAACIFLRDFAGVRWLMPTPCGVWNPPRKDILVPDDLNRKVVPTLLSAAPRLNGYGLWSPHNNLRVAVRSSGGNEMWGVAVPAAQYAKTHPEYFAMRNGKRQANPNDPECDSLCTSNPEVVNLLTAYVQKKFDEGNDIAGLGECDGYRGRACQCPECTRLFGPAWSEQNGDFRGNALRVFIPHMEVIKRCQKSHPNKLVLLQVYSMAGEYLTRIAAGMVPNPGIEFPSNTIAMIAGADWTDIHRFRRVVPRVGAFEYWWCVYHGGLSPKQTPDSAASYMRMVIDNNCFSMYFCGGGENWPAEAPTYYACARNAEQDPVPDSRELLNEFCAGLYSRAAGRMLSYYNLLYGRIRTLVGNNVCWCCDGGLFPDLPTNRLLGEKYVTFWPQDSIAKLDDLLKKAQEEARGDERALNWIRAARIGFDQVNLTAQVYHAHRAYEANKSLDGLRAIKSRIEDLNRYIRFINDLPRSEPQFVQDYFPNHQEFAKFLNQDEGFCCGRGVPFIWDLDKMIAGFSTAQQEKIIHARRTAARPGPDGALDPAAWADAKPVLLDPYGAANMDKDKQTFARALWDDDRLYVQFECREPSLDTLKLRSVGRGGDVYHQDCVELFLTPDRSDRKFMHLMAAPTKDAAYEERKGYVDNVMDPLYDKADVAWRADWTYAWKLDKENKLWTLEMAVTFKSLGQSTPKAGAVWTASFARTRRTAGGDGQLSSWSEEIGDPALFGKMQFEE